MKKTKILYYIFPFHIDLLERTIHQLKRAANYSNLIEYLSLDIVLDMSDKNIDWDKCSIPQQYFIDKFRYIEKYCDFCYEVNFEINNELLGSGAQHRRAFNNNKGEYNILALDPDIYFPPQIFQVLESTISAIKQETPTYIISFQIPKWWDNSWNIISNQEYINSDIKFDEINVFELEKKLDLNNVTVLKNYNHKFAGGWFTFYSSELTKLMEIPESIGIFYHQDLFQQEKLKILNKKGYNIPQYIVQNCMVAKDRKYYHKNDEYLRKYVPYQKDRPHMGKADEIFKEVINELNNLNNGLRSI